MRLVAKFARILSLAAGALFALAALADYPAPKEAAWVAKDFRFPTRAARSAGESKGRQPAAASRSIILMQG